MPEPINPVTGQSAYTDTESTLFKLAKVFQDHRKRSEDEIKEIVRIWGRAENNHLLQPLVPIYGLRHVIPLFKVNRKKIVSFYEKV